MIATRFSPPTRKQKATQLLEWLFSLTCFSKGLRPLWPIIRAAVRLELFDPLKWQAVSILDRK